ncbi:MULTISPECIES: serine/threonine-protein kinase [Streptomyces]|uniref:Serine/threonine protein kinase n=1 Tax=Streptomyces koelreuteriae TaxID=2838015 RepID=A0ABX8FRK3_9ACTN|nr:MULTISPECIES: serine/threonine-protein kinase [Streptomyces]QWB23818.1 serine/threonine protein kinase [Streptomyces koelreuteriae]UUA06798.1 serine/threonine protein kinase [Streptomyces koelreuteriae]UUA14427.1 serine/threonine protein kinase [Streptomyces sp. CRCS-T-1]
MRPLEVDEPTVVGPYRLLGRLGSGGMGRVYLGRSAGGRTVAVKIVHPHFALDEEFRARFRREVEAARRVGGAWTAPVLDADPEARVPWVATAYAAGPSLSAAVADFGPLPAHTVRALGAGLAEALAAVHELGLVHRDVKPSNVLLTLDGPLLIDFGIARATDGTASLTSTGVSIGSPGYMSPEQILGKGVTGAADVFSLGAVLAYAATGRPPFPGDSSAALLYKVVHEEPELGLLDGELRSLTAACLTKDLAARPAPAELARRLAPEGAARLVTGGWLPGALVEQVSRGAVQLLNLEAAGPGGGGLSGPVGFSSPSVGVGEREPGESAEAVGTVGTAGTAGAAEPGVFGPPPVMPTPAPAPPFPAVPAPRDEGPQDMTPSSTGRRPGKVTVSVAATSTPEGGGRVRRLSCSVALAVAGAMAAVTIGSVFVFDLLPGRGGQNDTGDSGAGADAQPSASDAAPGGAVPAAYLGTWEGQGTALDGNLPLGTFRITVERASVGQELGRLRQTDQIGGVCIDVLTLKQVTKKELVATSVGAKTNHSGCNPAATTVHLSPVGDDLRYRSESEESGRPQARMSKVR